MNTAHEIVDAIAALSNDPTYDEVEHIRVLSCQLDVKVSAVHDVCTHGYEIEGT